jgi:benzylsuccinate CoA-transferase BbsF subunit
VSCRFAAFAIMAALEYRRRTGKGQYIDQSQFESSIQFFGPHIMDYQINGHILGRNGNRCNRITAGVFPMPGRRQLDIYHRDERDQWQVFARL